MPEIASLLISSSVVWTRRGVGCEKGAGLPVCGKQSWALEGAWAFGKEGKYCNGWGGELGPGKCMLERCAAEILMRKPAWSH